MKDDNRTYERASVTINAALSFQDIDSRIIKTRNISASGMFLVVDDPDQFPIGEIVHLHFLNPLDDDADTFKDAVVVRIAADGIAVSFLDLGEGF